MDKSAHGGGKLETQATKRGVGATAAIFERCRNNVALGMPRRAVAPAAAGDVIAMSNGSRRFFRQGSVMNSAAQTFVIVAAGDRPGFVPAQLPNSGTIRSLPRLHQWDMRGNL